jgi:hypothetical protein
VLITLDAELESVGAIAMSKKYKFTYEWWDLELEVDPRKLGNFEEQLLFWSGGEDRIAKENGDVKKAFLKMLVAEIIVMSMTMSLTTRVRRKHPQQNKQKLSNQISKITT